MDLPLVVFIIDGQQTRILNSDRNIDVRLVSVWRADQNRKQEWRPENAVTDSPTSSHVS